MKWKQKPFPELARLAWPIVISLLSHSVMTIVDTLFVGRLGATALAAVGLGGSAAFFVFCFGIGLFAGAKVMASEAVGARQLVKAGSLLGAFLRIALVLGVAALILGEGLALLLPALNADLETGLLASRYCAVRVLAAPLVMVSAALSQWRQAHGDSRRPMKATLAANLVNIPLNALFITALGWGVEGAAWATVLSRGLEVGCLLKIQHADEGFFLNAGGWRLARRVLHFAAPAGVERWLDVAAFFVMTTLLGQLPPSELAAHQVGLQLLLVALLPVVAVGEAVSVLVAQALGAGGRHLATRVTLIGAAWASAYSLLCAGCCFVWGPALGHLLVADEATGAVIGRLLPVMGLSLLAHGAYSVAKGALRGAGDLRFVAGTTILVTWLFTPPLTALFGVYWGLGAAGAWAAIALETSMGFLLCVSRLRHRSQFSFGRVLLSLRRAWRSPVFNR